MKRVEDRINEVVLVDYIRINNLLKAEVSRQMEGIFGYGYKERFSRLLLVGWFEYSSMN